MSLLICAINYSYLERLAALPEELTDAVSRDILTVTLDQRKTGRLSLTNFNQPLVSEVMLLLYNY